MSGKLTARQVLDRFSLEDELPVFFGMALNDVNQNSPSGERPLDVAATRGSIEEIEALLEGGADINAIGAMGRTALHEAVAQDHAHVVPILLKAGASLLVRDKFGKTPLDIAQDYKLEEIANLLSAHKLGN
jgi:ankyrin repeat protein